MGITTKQLQCSLALLAVLFILVANCVAQAPLGYECFDGQNCYKLITNKKSFGQAWAFCKTEGAHLGIINSDQEAFIYSGIFSRKPEEKEMFVGIHDLFLEGTWLSIHCDSLASTGYATWREGEPNNADNEDCGAMHQGGLLNDVECDDNRMFICEIKPMK